MIKQFYGTLTGITNLSGTGSNGSERILHIPQSSGSKALQSDCLLSYPGHSLGHGGGVFPLRRNAVGVFYSPNRQEVIQYLFQSYTNNFHSVVCFQAFLSNIDAYLVSSNYFPSRLEL